MSLAINEESADRLAEYARVPISFLVTMIFDDYAIQALSQGTLIPPTPVADPYWKDYDAYASADPTNWAARFDLSRWTILAAYLDRERVGGAAVAIGDPRLDLQESADVAVLWDLRVAPHARRRGVGTALLHAAEQAARGRGARALCVETQQVNVPACRFYFQNGFSLENAARGAYPELPNEVQLLWLKSLEGERR